VNQNSNTILVVILAILAALQIVSSVVLILAFKSTLRALQDLFKKSTSDTTQPIPSTSWSTLLPLTRPTRPATPENQALTVEDQKQDNTRELDKVRELDKIHSPSTNLEVEEEVERCVSCGGQREAIHRTIGENNVVTTYVCKECGNVTKE